MANNPSKSDIETIFNRIRTFAINKSCFDCSAKNPTWASVTYGVFICIDCSAVHRSLGVHLSFVRSTNLDTNWTWMQIRQMQLGGNANAAQFFRLHNCNTADAQQKYNSRAAQLYKDKLQNMAQQAMRLHGNSLFLDSIQDSVEAGNNEKSEDFFADCTNIDNNDFLSNNYIINNDETKKGEQNDDLFHTPTATLLKTVDLSDAPNVDFSLSSEPIKSTIGVRKIQPKKSGIGSRKGLGATRVKTNFADIEQKATMADKLNEPVPEKKLTEEEEQNAIASVRLAYKDLSMKQNKEEERLKSVDPTKAKQMERLGMGFNFNKSGFSHSALTDMQTITQENAPKSSTKNYEKESNNDFFDDYPTSMYSSSSVKQDLLMMGFETIEPIEPRQKNIQTMFSATPNSKSTSSISDQPGYSKANNNRSSSSAIVNNSNNDDVAQKKFGSAKGISSDQYFGNETSEFERSVNMNRFQGSNSISSSDYFGDSGATNRGSSNNKSFDMDLTTPDFDELKESARNSITKVAGKLSNLANNVMTSLQDKYGY